MKRRREVEMVASEIRSAIQELSLLAVNLKTGGAAADDVQNQTSAHVPIKPFLSLCNLLIQVLDKIGPTMAVLRQDIHQNIQCVQNTRIHPHQKSASYALPWPRNSQPFILTFVHDEHIIHAKRLETFHDSDPSIYWDVVEILKKEVNEGKAKKGPTCSKAFVWLTRSLDFTLALLQLLVKDFGRNMEQAVEESYNITLKPWHGWISSAAYKVALKLVPDTQTLINILKVKDEDDDTLKEEMQSLISLLMPVLEQNKDILRTHGLDKLKST